MSKRGLWVVLAIVLSLALGVGLASAVLLPKNAGLESEVANLQTTGGDSDMSLQGVEQAWSAQVRMLRSREPTSDAVSGIYRARIVDASRAPRLTVEWLDSEPRQSVGTNRVEHRQVVVHYPLCAVYVWERLSSEAPDVQVLRGTNLPAFVTSLKSGAGDEYLKREWWVVVDDGEWVQLIEAPTSP